MTPNDSILQAVEAMREPASLAARLRKAWASAGFVPASDIEIRVLQTHYKPFHRARLLVEARFERTRKPGKKSRQYLFIQIYADPDLPRQRMASAMRKRMLKCFAPPVILLEEFNAVVWSLPNGPQLRPSKFFLRRKKFDRFVRESGLVNLPQGRRASLPALRRLVPRKRALFRYDEPAARAEALYIKCYGPGQDATAAANLHRIGLARSEGRLEFEVPDLIMHVPRRRTIIMSEVRGRPLTACMPDLSEQVAEGLGRALASLHRTDIECANTWSALAELDALERALRDAQAAMPGLALRLDGLRARLAVAAERLHFDANTVIHGNLFGDQVLIDGDRIGVVDWDDLARGDGLYDLGRLIAHWVFFDLAEAHNPRRSNRAIESLCRGYSANARVECDLARLRWHVATGLLMRAKINLLRTLEPDWASLFATAVDEADAILNDRRTWFGAARACRDDPSEILVGDPSLPEQSLL